MCAVLCWSEFAYSSVYCHSLERLPFHDEEFDYMWAKFLQTSDHSAANSQLNRRCARRIARGVPEDKVRSSFEDSRMMTHASVILVGRITGGMSTQLRLCLA